MSFDDIDEYTVMLADAYAKDAYQKGYEAGKRDAVKYGHWIFTGRTYKCSNCCLKEDNAVEADLCDMPLLNFKFCPNCGAKMDGVENEVD